MCQNEKFHPLIARRVKCSSVKMYRDIEKFIQHDSQI